MAEEVEIDIRGIAETQQAIYQFSEKLGDRVTLLALRAGANFMLKKIRAAAPVRTGRLRKAIKVSTSKINRRRRNGKVGVFLRINPGKSRDDLRGAYYGKFVENRKHFVRDTFNQNKDESLDIILAALEQGGQRISQELNR